MKAIIRWFDNQKLYVKILFVVIGASLVLTVSYISIWHFGCKAYNNYIYEKNAQIFIAYTQQMENKFEKLDTTTLAIIGNTSLQKNLASYIASESMEGEWFDTREEILKQLNSHIGTCRELLSFGLYPPDSRMIGSRTDLPADSVEKLTEEAIGEKGAMKIVVLQNRVFLVRQIREYVTLKNLGVMIGELDIAGMLQENGKEYQETGMGLNVSVFVGEECVYSDDENVTVMEKDGWVIEDGYFITQSTTKDGWIYLIYTPYQEILETIQKTEMIAVILMILLACYVIFLCWIILRRTLEGIGKMVLKFEAYGKGVLPTREEMEKYQDRGDEIGYLYRHFDQMVYEHKQLEEENYNRMLLQKEAEYKQLQKQIQPHFIFNTLSLISWLSYEHKDMEIAELTNSLSVLLRGTMTFNENVIPVEKEIQMVESYIYIQRFRYGSRIEFTMNIPHEMYKVRIPQMTLQPLVENAITYALEEMVDTCVINLYGKVEGDTAVFVVEDNGEGIEEDILEKLASGDVQAKGNGIGLLNVHQRIQIMFSKRYGLSFKRENDITQVYVRVPLN